jgi:hypothetical protein
LMFFPVGLPLGFDLLRIVLCHCFIPLTPRRSRRGLIKFSGVKIET